MKTYGNEHLTVTVEGGVHLIRQTWIGLPTSESFQTGSLATMALANKHRPKRWLIDLQQLRLFNPIDLHWFLQEWLPRAIILLPHNVRVAIVLNDINQFGKMGADLILRAAFQQNNALASRYFVENEEARQWLMNQS